MEKTQDLRTQKTLNAIHSTFREMMLEMDYEKITVTELSKRAEINKKTFYRYYPTMDDLLAEFQMTMSTEYIELISKYKLPEEFDKVNEAFFRFSESQGKLYEKITCSGNFQYMRQKMIDNVMTSTWSKSAKLNLYDMYRQNIILSFIQTSSIEMYKQWVKDRKKLPLDDVIKLSNSLLCDGLFGTLR